MGRSSLFSTTRLITRRRKNTTRRSGECAIRTWGERRRVEEIDWDEVDRLGLSATQWVTDDEPMRQQMAIALRRLEEQERRAKRRYQPILFVVAACKGDAEKADRTLRQDLN